MPRIVSKNPATEEVIGSVLSATRRDISGFVCRSKKAQQAWHELGLYKRRNSLSSVKNRVITLREDLENLIVKETGKPINDARRELDLVINTIDQDLKNISNAFEPEIIFGRINKSTIYHDPIGVCVCITPWNFPLAKPHSLILPALLAGNSVLFKPSEKTPLTGKLYGNILQEFIPENVLQIIQGSKNIGKALVRSPVDMIAFVGSQDVGKEILQISSKSFKHTLLELGGKDPIIVLNGANIDKAVNFAVRNSFKLAGQICVSTEQIILLKDIAEIFISKMVSATSNLVVGNGFDKGTQVGPVIDNHHCAYIENILKDAILRGGKILIGGSRLGGNFISPTIITGLDDNADLMSKEIFGPIVYIRSVNSQDEAISIANKGDFALGAVVFGPEHEAQMIARRLNAGMVGINGGVRGSGDLPWVGHKYSGYGFYGSKDGHRQFTLTKVVTKHED